MMPVELYLKPNVVVEPLVNKWHATPPLIAPTTAAMLMSHKYLPIIRSFLDSPDQHFAASKNPALIGGPFIAYPPSRVPEMRALLEQVLSEQAPALALAKAIADLSTSLEGAVGDSLEGRYKSLPEPLRGRVELLYDVHHRPFVRFIEPLLYASSSSGIASSQSVALSATIQDERPFALSTPKLAAPNELHLKLPFKSEALSALAAMRSHPRSLENIAELLCVTAAADQDLLASYFTDAVPRRRPAYDSSVPRIRYMGHACVLVELNGKTILFDPFIGYENDANGDAIVARYSYADLPETLDCIFLTHAHLDHCVPETLLQLRHKTKAVAVPKNNGGRLADPSMRLILESMGFTDVREVDELETINVGSGVSVTSVPFLGEHGDLDVRAKCAWIASVGSKKIMLAADSNALDATLYEQLVNIVGAIDVLFIGMECVGAPMSWAYGSLFPKPLNRKFDQTRRINGTNCERAFEIAQRMRARQVYVYAMGQEPWMSHVMGLSYTADAPQLTESNKLIQQCKTLGVTAERLFGRHEILLD